MLMFFASVGTLILGYFIYGRLVDRLFGSDPARKTPAVTLEDGVDYVMLPPWKIFLILGGAGGVERSSRSCTAMRRGAAPRFL